MSDVVTIELKDSVVITTSENETIQLPLNQSYDLKRFKVWIESYNQALKETSPERSLLRIGQEMLAWLNYAQWFEKLLKNPPFPLIIEFQTSQNPSELGRAFLELPWELLANKNEHLAQKLDLMFCPLRRIGEKSSRRPHSPHRLRTVFMAASPRNIMPELDYEAEESAILHLVSGGRVKMELLVEESGNMENLV